MMILLAFNFKKNQQKNKIRKASKQSNRRQNNRQPKIASIKKCEQHSVGTNLIGNH